MSASKSDGEHVAQLASSDVHATAEDVVIQVEDDHGHGMCVWSLSDLRVFSEIQKPIAIVVAGAYADPHSPGGVKDFSRVIYQNGACKKAFGLPRPIPEYTKLFKQLPDEDLQLRHKFVMKALKAQGETVKKSWMDIKPFLKPVFQGITDESPPQVCRLDSRGIRVETSVGHVETAVMHLVDTDSDATDLRVGAMHCRNPLHTFMFDGLGTLLNANEAALHAFHHHYAEVAPGAELTLRALFTEGIYPGGEEQAQAAYDEAMNAVFTLRVDCHRHTQPHKSKKDGTIKWAIIEMWPMQDPVDASPAVLVKRYNITEQKHLEIQLIAHQDALQRHNQELEQDSVAMRQEQVRLQQEAKGLAQRLEVILHDKFQHRHKGFDSDTPVDKTLSLLQGIIEGRTPPVQVALELYNMLSESGTNLRQPVGLEDQLLQDQRMDSDVGQSMLQLLQGSSSNSRRNIQLPQAAQHVAPRPAETPNHVLSVSQSTVQQQGTVQEQATVQQGPLQQLGSAQEDESVPLVLSTRVERFLLDAEHNWQFDVFAFAEATPGVTLSLLGFHFHRVAGFIQEFDLDASKLFRFLQRIEQGYVEANPYHNSIHVASVVQMTHMLLCHGGVMKSKALSSLQQQSAYWSAIVHDFEHGGLNNDFLIKTMNPLAITYNDQSPLENHHMAAAIRVMRLPDCNYRPARFVTSGACSVVRATSINMVLGTDMKKHFDIMSRFQNAFKKAPVSSAPAGPSAKAEHNSLVDDWDSIKDEDKTLVHQMVLKCADIGHLAAEPSTHKRWAFQLEEEFFRQGDKEKGLGLPVSPLMDRSLEGGMTRSQLGFFNIVGTPMFRALVDLFPDAQPMLDGVQANYAHWQQAAASQHVQGAA